MDNLYEYLTVLAIKESLEQSSSELYNRISLSKCKKWNKWFANKEVPYPCVCPIRDKYCIKLELYYELQKISEIQKQEPLFIEAINDYSLCENHSEGLIAWAKKYEDLGSKLFFTTTIEILRSYEKNDKLIVQLNPDEFGTVIQFQELFNTVYYSEEYQTNNNL